MSIVPSLSTFKRWWWHAEAANPSLTPDGAPAVAAAPSAEPPWLRQLDRAGIPRTLNYPSTTLARLLDQSADRFGDVTALVYRQRRWTYRELLELVNRAAAGLAGLGVRRGDRVLMTLPNCPESVIAFFAVQKLGAVVVNAGPLMGLDDLRTTIGMTAPRVAIGLDLFAAPLTRAAHGSKVEHFVWASLRGYQHVFNRVGYQVKLWHGRAGKNGDGAEHVAFDDLLAHAPSRPPSLLPDPGHTAILQPTGGTTGTLKLAQITHAGILANATQVCTWMGCRAGQERVLTVLPAFHVYGLTLGLISPILSASTMIVMTRFHAPEMLGLIRRHRPTILPVVPAICDALADRLEREDDGDRTPFDSVRLCFSGAAPLPANTAERFQKLTGLKLVEGYGLTEASPVTHSCLPGEPRPGSIGLPMPDTRARVVDVETGLTDVPPGEPGELLVAGPQVMAGYFADAENTARSLTVDRHGVTWLHTGDVVRCDVDGFFYVLDRKKEMIIRSGLKIYPNKVEKVLRTHPQVADAAVVGRPDPTHTQLPVAVIAPREMPDDPAELEAELRTLCREHLAPYEVPASFEFLDKLPRSPLGKLLKRELMQPPSKAPAAAAPAPMPQPQPHNGKDVS